MKDVYLDGKRVKPTVEGFCRVVEELERYRILYKRSLALWRYIDDPECRIGCPDGLECNENNCVDNIDMFLRDDTKFKIIT